MAWFGCLFVFCVLPCYSMSRFIYVEEPDNLHLRSKRSFEANKPWPDRVIPYVFDTSVPLDVRQKYRGFMQTLEKNTCIRFYEKASLNSTHTNVAPHTAGAVLIHLDRHNCYVSGMGYGGGGMKMSPCTNPITYVHEFGHLLGIAHVQERYERNELLYAEPENMGAYYQHFMNLGSASKQSNWKMCDLSLGSVMMYDQYSFTWHGWPIFNYLTPNQPTVSVSNLYNFIREVSIANRCCGTSSCEQSGYYNEGYQGKYEGTCQAVCPSGLDPATNCSSVIRSSQHHSWPSAVTLLAPTSGCPDLSFKEGTMYAQGDGRNAFTSTSLKGLHTASIIETHFCTKRDRHYNGVWGPGNYCFLRADKHCPLGFQEASWFVRERPFLGSTKFINIDVFPEGHFDRNGSNYSFCCRNDGVAWNKLSLPNQHPFILFKTAGSSCQSVEGMSVSEESMIFDQAGPSSSSYTLAKPDFVEDGKDYRLTMKYCRYEPADYNCGGFYNLNSSNPEVTIRSPGFPFQYGHNRECNWAFKAPEGSKIVLDCGRVGLGCGDKLQIRKRVFGEIATDVLLKEDTDMPPVLSVFNKIMLTLTTQQHSCGMGGFSCTATFHSDADLPYTGRGEDYCGNMNYAVNELGFHECLPWSDVFEKSPDAYVSPNYEKSFHHCDYESNYCRNPSGDRLMPYCATSVDERNVTLQYCDVGRFIKPFDVSTNCPEMMKRDPLCRLRETRRVCFKSCKDHRLIKNWPASEKTVRQVTCPPLQPIQDVIFPKENRHFHVGEHVTLKCISGPVSVNVTCLSNGKWSKQRNFCKGTGCPEDFTPLNGNCYHGNIVKRTGNAARAYCASLGTHLVWPESRDELENSILVYRNKFMKLPNTKLWFGMHTNKTHWFSDYDNSLIQGAYMWGNNQENGYGTTDTNYMPMLKPNNSVYGANTLIKQRPNGLTCKLICKTKSTGSTCSDRASNCADLLEIIPKFSTLLYAAKFCRYTVGSCQAASCTVPTPAIGVTVSATTVATGNFVHYECSAGYTATGEGNNFRACRRDGTLTGAELVCQEKSQSPFQLVKYPMQDSTGVSKQNEIMTGPSVYLTVKRDSRVMSCRAYCRNSGALKLQFWGPGVSPKHFVLKSEKTVKCVGRSENIWEFGSGWNVTTGQFLGVFDMTGNLVTRHNCHGTKTIGAAQFVRFHTVTGRAPSVGDTLMFSLYPACFTVMADCLMVPDTYSGPPRKFTF